MQQSSKGDPSGHLKIHPNVYKASGSEGWGVFSAGPGVHASSDASLFSSSLPVLPHQTLNSNNGYQYTNDVSARYEKIDQNVENKDLLEDFDDVPVGSMLPDDEDELLAGIMDGFDVSGRQMDDLEEYDLFGSGGGMELEPDPLESLSKGMWKINLSEGNANNGVPHFGFTNCTGTVSGEHPYGEHPSRTLFVRNINSGVEDSELRTLFEQFGDIRMLHTTTKGRGFVMISYYDIRSARTAMRALQNKPLRKRKLDIHFSIPKDNPTDKDLNQGTLVVFNLDPSVGNDDLLKMFGAYGEVKEIRETPHKRHHKFIEYYDVRAAEAALKSLNRIDIAGKRIKLEPSRPGGTRRSLMLQLNQELEQDESRSFQHHIGSPVTHSPPGSWTQFGSPIARSPLQSSPAFRSLNSTNGNSLPGLASILHSQTANSGRVAPIGNGRSSYVEDRLSNSNLSHGSPFQQSHSFPEPKMDHFSGTMSSFGASTSNGSGIETLSGPQFLWGSPKPYPEQSKSNNVWQKPSVANPCSHGLPIADHHGSFVGSSQHHPNHHHHVGSAPSGVHMERHFGSYQQSPETAFMSPLRYGSMGLGHKDTSFLMNIGPRAAMNSGTVGMPEIGSPGFRMMSSSPRLSPGFPGNGHYPGMIPTSVDGFERGRNRRMESNGSQDSKRQFQLDLDKIKSGEDIRTTLMIKNIPNKYTSKMLLAAIDENYKGTYDFLYLPIDFKNKCNVGYAFINMLSPSHIIPFYEAFNGKKWEKFNSEKVASLAYARIQGKSALVTHFQNSSLMNEDKRCRPIVFHPEGSDAGHQELSSANVLNICQPNGSQFGDSSTSPPKGSENENSGQL